MRNVRNRSLIRPKVSTMPRNKSEASTQLELYQMVTEKERIKQELYRIKERTALLKQRLVTLNKQIEETEKTIHRIRQQHDSIHTEGSQNPKKTGKINPNTVVESVEPRNYHVLEIEY
ncbi:hypothetical protein NWP17_17150 [Chrysosporum bergii ANA360D]|uniref:Gas vesicle protein n=1 Tax=Chrysosporum bergii ANA360D TaxID=617107 RepID=A0AA43GV20_9CYAN|nr:hypothetical protein [Chrysosporum bergii]MDH6062140.1 hypothetical protein [Chrysosporum bergii ANA360D]